MNDPLTLENLIPAYLLLFGYLAVILGPIYLLSWIGNRNAKKTNAEEKQKLSAELRETRNRVVKHESVRS